MTTETLRLVSGENGTSVDYQREPKYRPKRGHILIRKRERDVSPSGLYLPGNMEKSLREGEVVLVGKPAMLANGLECPVDVKVGEIVLYSEPAALVLDPHDPSLCLLVEENVLAVRLEHE